MCGIIGTIGDRNIVPALIGGLRQLEYRGYDSAGVAAITQAHTLARVRTEGKIASLDEKVTAAKLEAPIGIGHTRWATHGAPVERNAHPHFSPDGRFAVVHNGIIENASEIKSTLLKGGVFASDTDTEVIAHLLQLYYTGDVVQAIRDTCRRLRGAWALAILCLDTPDTLYGAASGSPLLAAKGENGVYLASDAIAIREKAVGCRLHKGEICALDRDALRFFDAEGKPVFKELAPVSANENDTDKGVYAHHMLHEIMQQPDAVGRTLSPLIEDGRVVIDDGVLSADFVKNGLREIKIVACGSAYHTGMTGAMLFERLSRVSARAEIASEFRYASPLIDEGTLAIFVSQSGETADTLAALRLAKERGAKILSIVNVPGSAIASESDCVIHTKAGREIAVATTKAYSAQLSVFYALAIRLASLKGEIDEETARRLAHELAALPDRIAETIEVSVAPAKALAEQIYARPDMFFIGRQLDFATATEGSLKMKEISYLNSQAYAAGELKHGTISLVEPGTPVIAVATDPAVAAKTQSNVCEVKARGAKSVAVVTRSLAPAFADADVVFTVPDTSPYFAGSLAVLPLQLLSYYTALKRGCDIDQPKNLAKSVTVE
ncbi:MAG: glutamine--fructose-6-phosphate transaminase (isomerizing) [Clostridia bacterium]|nr:glutamine--fructose-6-phosphate transaminase (isomerizing) [Clostridia bacterium]